MFNTNDLRKKLHVLWNRHCLTVFALVAVVGTSYAAMNHADALYILTGVEDSAIVLDDETDTADLSSQLVFLSSNSTGIFSSGRSSNTAARSGAFMVDMTSRRLWYFLASSRLASIWRSTAMVLFAIKNSPCAAVVSTQTHKEGEIFQNEASVPCAKNAHTNSKWLRIEPPPAPLHRNNGCHYIQFYIGSQDYRESPCLTTCLLCWIFIIMVPCFAAKAL